MKRFGPNRTVVHEQTLLFAALRGDAHRVFQTVMDTKAFLPRLCGDEVISQAATVAELPEVIGEALQMTDSKHATMRGINRQGRVDITDWEYFYPTHCYPIVVASDAPAAILRIKRWFWTTAC